MVEGTYVQKTLCVWGLLFWRGNHNGFCATLVWDLFLWIFFFNLQWLTGINVASTVPWIQELWIMSRLLRIVKSVFSGIIKSNASLWFLRGSGAFFYVSLLNAIYHLKLPKLQERVRACVRACWMSEWGSVLHIPHMGMCTSRDPVMHVQWRACRSCQIPIAWSLITWVWADVNIVWYFAVFGANAIAFSQQVSN